MVGCAKGEKRKHRINDFLHIVPPAVSKVPKTMMGFLMFWVAVAAALLNAVPALAGTLLGVIGGFGRIKIAFALAGPAIVALSVVSYLSDPYAQFSDQVYNVGVLFFSMFAWSLFTGGVTVTARELLPNRMQLDLLKRRLGLESETSTTNPAEW